MRGLVHHVVLTASNLEAAFAFYDAVLTDLGYRLESNDEHGYEWQLAAQPDAHSIAIVKARGDGAGRPHDRYSPGLHHLAWAVESRSDVDRMHDRLRSIDATVLDPPAEYPQYNRGRGYYAVFFTDPDGLKLECVFTPAIPADPSTGA
jgi:catechol 2,3-dioxygenase-like lactoylglutathione lyase family enzyme